MAIEIISEPASNKELVLYVTGPEDIKRIRELINRGMESWHQPPTTVQQIHEELNRWPDL